MKIPRTDRRCFTCKQRKPLSEFTKNRGKTYGYDYECKECRSSSFKNEMRHLKKYGLSMDDYNVLLEKQNGGCAICGKTDKNKILSVDHNHTTGKVRALLCTRCNVLIGTLESLEYPVDSLFQYLKEYN